MGIATFRRHTSEGFTLVELLVATVILAIVAAGTAQVFVASNNQLIASRNRNEQQAAIDQDLAALLQLNDRYTCSTLPASGATTANCTVAGADPGEAGYIPNPSAAVDSGYERFRTLCSNGTLNAAVITAAAGLNPQPGAGVTRNVITDPNDTGTPLAHRYQVQWTAGGVELRRQVLVPTVAGWCP